MKYRSIHRPTSRLERHGPWLFVGVAVTVLIVALVAAAANGALASLGPTLWGRTLRGYTGVGLILGVASVVLAALTFAYSLRKRLWQESAPLPIRSTMMAWLWTHVYFGLLALVAAVFHAGTGLFTAGLSTGIILLALLGLLVFSGIVWRLIYRYVPPAAAAQVGNYSLSESRAWAQSDRVEIEKLSAGKSTEFQRLKNALLAGQPATDDSALTEAEQEDFILVRAYAAGRLSTLQRLQRQAAFDRLLKFWKIIHIPLAGLALLFLILHVLVVFDIPAQALPAQLDGFHPASDCAQCHAAIYEQWSQSMHAHALTSPVTIAQVNLVNATTFAEVDQPDPYLFCNNCHGPVGARLTGQATLPLTPSTRPAIPLVTEGVSCTVCHQFNGEAKAGQGGLRSFNNSLRPGRIFFGGIADPAGNVYHQSQPAKLFNQPDLICKNCHTVSFDRNQDGQIEKGVDLILQTIYTEWERYREAGGTQSCVSCHMPLVDGATRVAEAAAIPGQQDYAAPPRQLHNHSFVGVDYSLDTVAQNDPQREARAALLRQTAKIVVDSAQIEEDNLRFKVSVTNSGAGHNIPGGFSFARQMWLEVIVKDESGQTLYQSGVLASNTADLCDAATLADPGNPVLAYLQGCAESDPQLVNFQQKLVSDVEQVLDANGQPALDDHGDPIVIQAANGAETWLQSLDAGAVSRFRPADGQELDTIDPGQTRQFEYQVLGLNADAGPLTIQVRLLFRNFPPYFLRALAANQLPSDPVKLAPLIENLQIVEMAAETYSYQSGYWIPATSMRE